MSLHSLIVKTHFCVVKPFTNDVQAILEPELPGVFQALILILIYSDYSYSDPFLITMTTVFRYD